MNCIHGGSGEKAIDFSGLGGVAVLAFRTVCSSAVGERGSVIIDVERGGRIGVGRCVVNCRVIIQQIRAFKAFYDRSGVGTGEVIGVMEPGGISDGEKIYDFQSGKVRRTDHVQVTVNYCGIGRGNRRGGDIDNGRVGVYGGDALVVRAVGTARKRSSWYGGR